MRHCISLLTSFEPCLAALSLLLIACTNDGCRPAPQTRGGADETPGEVQPVPSTVRLESRPAPVDSPQTPAATGGGPIAPVIANGAPVAAGEGFDSPSSWTILSPNRSVRATVELADRSASAGFPPGPRLYYTLELGDGASYTTLLEASPLGIARSDQSFIDGLVLAQAGRSTRVDETYEMLTGKRRRPHNFANQRVLTFSNPAGARLGARAAGV
jgi:hypothetical protein